MDGEQVFADTSGFLALMDKDDAHHCAAVCEWKSFAESQTVLWTSDYVRLESCSLIQRRLGAAALVEFHDRILPVATIAIVGEDGFESAFAHWRISQLRHLSIVDLTSFDCMHREKIVRAFAFDRHFQEQGFIVSAA